MRRNERNSRFSREILRWYGKNRRDLPWRRTRDPFRILVSEVMLQQTQVDRVRTKYAAFLRRFPTVRALARAPRAAVLHAWSGLGYNNRAVRLHRASQEIVQQHRGVFPRDVAALERLPGVGKYTARAVACFAFGERVTTVDVNHARALGRFFYGVEKVQERIVQEKALAVLPKDAYAWNHALMDFGALVCRVRPRCEVCPVRDLCRAYPAVLRPSKKITKNKERFFGSDRYLRGQIVSLLRNAPWHRMTKQSIVRALSAIPSSNAKRVAMLLGALERDGVVSRNDASIVLG